MQRVSFRDFPVQLKIFALYVCVNVPNEVHSVISKDSSARKHAQNFLAY